MDDVEYDEYEDDYEFSEDEFSEEEVPNEFEGFGERTGTDASLENTEITESTSPQKITGSTDDGGDRSDDMRHRGKDNIRSTHTSGEVDKKRLIEAALFMSSTPISLERLGKLIGVSAPGYVKNIIRELEEEYRARGSSIEIVEEDTGYLMTVRKRYVPYVKEFAKEAELTRAALRALAYISKHNGILKSDMVKRLGVWVYPAVKELIDKGFIIGKRYGRSQKLFLSKKFKEYFEGG